MARSAGTRALGVSWGFHTAAEIAAAGAHEIHDSYDSLNQALDRFAPGEGKASL
jgi:phosphoglycolate phosphatase